MTGTITFQYDEVRLGRWIERKVDAAGIHAIVGAVVTGVAFHDRRVLAIELATRFGSVRVEANGFVDASGDVVLEVAIFDGCRELRGHGANPTSSASGSIRDRRI